MAQAVLKKQHRLEARITPSQKRLIERAAKLKGTSVTAFVLDSAQEAATKTINELEILNLSNEARAQFVNALLNPPEPTAAARAAAARYRESMGR